MTTINQSRSALLTAETAETQDTETVDMKAANDDYVAADRQESTQLWTNRRRAIIWINVFCVFEFGYVTLIKVAVNSKGIDPLDICLARMLVLIGGSWLISLCTGVSFRLEPHDRCWMILRGLLCATGITCMTYGIAMIPLTLQNTIFNTGPIWASI